MRLAGRSVSDRTHKRCLTLTSRVIRAAANGIQLLPGTTVCTQNRLAILQNCFSADGLGPYPIAVERLPADLTGTSRAAADGDWLQARARKGQ